MIIFEQVPYYRRNEREHVFFQVFNVMYLNVTPTGMLHVKITCSFIRNVR